MVRLRPVEEVAVKTNAWPGYKLLRPKNATMNSKRMMTAQFKGLFHTPLAHTEDLRRHGARNSPRWQ